MRTYNLILKDLKKCLNTKRDKITPQQTKNLLIELKPICLISTKFLRNLLNKSLDNRQKTNRIYYLLKNAGLITERQNRYFKSWITEKYKTDIVTYARSKKDNAVFIKDIRVQNIGKTFRGLSCEVLHIVKV